MILKLNLKEDNELRKEVLEIVKGQMKHVARKDILEITNEVISSNDGQIKELLKQKESKLLKKVDSLLYNIERVVISEINNRLNKVGSEYLNSEYIKAKIDKEVSMLVFNKFKDKL